MEYEVIRSNRKTISVEVKPNGVLIRAPMAASDRDIARFVRKNREWIERHSEMVRQESEAREKLTADEIRSLAEKARDIIPKRVEYYAQLIGVTYGRITIRNQRTRWGSCSSKGNLNFNCLLMLTPPEAIDSVVVHELCHRKEMNHSEKFYAEVLRAFPDYRKWEKWLKDNGTGIMNMMI